jgi:hypothetical protein
LVEASILEKLAVSVFRAEVISWDSEVLYMVAGGKSEGKNQPAQSEVEPVLFSQQNKFP